MSESEAQKLYEWLMSEDKQNPQTYFTEGMARNIAREIYYQLNKP